MGLPVRDHEHHTYGDYRTWDDDTRYELIDGIAYTMAPTPTRIHQEVAGEIYRQAANALEGSRCRALIAPLDVRLPRAGEADDWVDTVLQPDGLAVCDPGSVSPNQMTTGRRASGDPDKLDERGVRGAPDWVVEVLSPATAGHDQIHKRRVYEQHGVAELWLVHPTDHLLTIYRLEEGEYGKPEIVELEGETTVGGVMPEVAIQWDALADRLPEPAP